MATRSALLFALTSTLVFGCMGQQSPVARAQEAANELNLNTRFGRMEMATEHVAPDAREAFLARRRTWGANVRVADYEFAGFHMKGDRDAEMFVKVAWYRMDQGDLHTTLLKQKWHDFKGDWKLTDEDRADGDIGLIGEPMPAPSADAVKASGAARTQFPTIRLGQSEDAVDSAGQTPAAPPAVMPAPTPGAP
jgi:hypothetical protein